MWKESLDAAPGTETRGCSYLKQNLKKECLIYDSHDKKEHGSKK